MPHLPLTYLGRQKQPALGQFQTSFIHPSFIVFTLEFPTLPAFIPFASHHLALFIHACLPPFVCLHTQDGSSFLFAVGVVAFRIEKDEVEWWSNRKLAALACDLPLFVGSATCTSSTLPSLNSLYQHCMQSVYPMLLHAHCAQPIFRYASC